MDATARLTSIRVLQAGLVLAALLATLSWQDAGVEIRTTGHDGVALAIEAPVVDPRGPWEIGDVLTASEAGIDVSVAPVWKITAVHEATGVALEAGGWTATSRIEKVSGDGRPWWVVEEALPIDVDGDRATLTLDAAAFVARAAELDESGRTPGRLDASVTVAHDGVVVVNGARNAAHRTSVLQLSPSGTIVSIGVVEDTAEWSSPETRALPWEAALLVLGASAFEPVARRVGRSVPVWARARGVHVVEASVPPPARDAPRCDLPTAIAAAKKTGSVLLIDRAQGVALVQGAVTLVADLEPQTVEFNVVPRSPSPTRKRPLTPLTEVFRAPDPFPDAAFEVAGAVPPPVGGFVPFVEVPQDARRAR